MANIELNNKIDDVELSSTSMPEDFEKVELDQATKNKYQNRYGLNIWDRLRLTWRGENESGRTMGFILDIAESFAPEWVAKIRTQIQYKIMSKQSKPAPKSKTVITFGLLFIVGLVQLLGVDLGLELSADAQWVSAGVGLVGVILRLVTNKPVKLGERLGLSK